MKALFLLFFAIFAASAQPASLSGVVTDESGAVLQGAVVRVNGPGRFVKSTKTDLAGNYVFTGLPAGAYTLQAAATGLALPAPVKVALQSGTQVVNLQLKVATVNQKLDVAEETAPEVNVGAANNASATVIKGEDLAALADNPDDLLADLQALAGPSAGPNGDSLLIDGFSGGQLPPKESIREVRINSNPFSPEYDKIGFGRIEIFTKPGAKIFRGNVDYNFMHDFWNSRNPYAPVKAPLRLHELEGGGTGPLGKRASFTFDGLRNAVDNGFIVNAVTLNAQNQPAPFSTIFNTPQRMVKLSPRVDYQLNETNTASVRYTFNQADINGFGIGGFDLPSRGYRLQYTYQTLQLTETAILGEKIFETRFQYIRGAHQFAPRGTGPALNVLSSFSDGGVPTGNARDTTNSYELQNLLTFVKGRHYFRFGSRFRGMQDDNYSPTNFAGTYTFGGGIGPVLDANDRPLAPGAQAPISSIERYRRTLAFQSAGLSATQIRALGGGATQFTVNAGNPSLNLGQFDAGLFMGDEWRLRPNLTLNLGLRYELQNNITDWGNIAPRVALAWAPTAGPNAKPKSVFRAGVGMFYDRFALGNTIAAARYNGLVQQQYVVSNPDFFPTIPNPATLAAFRSSQITQVVAGDAKAFSLLQSAYTWERQLPHNSTLAVTYSFARGNHMPRSRNINAPLNGLFPLGASGPLYLMETSGVYRQNQVAFNSTSKLSAKVSIFAYYVWSKAKSNTDGVGTFPARQYDYSGEYGPAASDIRHRVTIGGTLNMPWAVRFNPFVTLQSGAPYDITTGSDLYGTTLFNARPGFATDPNKPGVVRTSYGLLDPTPSPSQTLLDRNYGRGPGQYLVNLRMAKTIGFGPEKGGAPKGAQSATTTGPVMAAPGSTGASIGGGGRAVAGAATVNRRYNLIVSMSVRNLLNHTNPGPIIGNITSPIFGQANRMAGNVNGEGFSENASNRRLELQMRLNF